MSRTPSRRAATGNTRNGTSPKTLVTEHGQVAIDAPRDRDGTFEPKIVRKRQRRFEGFDDKILALYTAGLSTRDIEAHLAEIYGVKVGRELISKVTDGVMDDARAWAQRPLEDVYPVVFLDALVLKIREGGSVQRRACYLALGVTARGRPRRAGPVVPRTGGRQILDAGPVRAQAPRRLRHPDLLRRRAERLPGGDRGHLPQDHGPNLHRAPDPPFLEVRAATRARAGRPRSETDLHRGRRRRRRRPSSSALMRSGAPRFPVITQAWLNAWEYVTPFLAFPPEVRRVIYTTNAIEALNRQLRKAIKTKGHFPNEDAARKLIYLALHNAVPAWTRTRNWTVALLAFKIHFGDRVPDTAS